MTEMQPSPPGPDEPVFTSADVQRLNRLAIVRAAFFARVGGSAAIAAGALLALGWLWAVVRSQQSVSGLFGRLNEDAEFVDRVDAFTSTLGLLFYAAATSGVGFALRLVADYTQSNAGGSVTGYQAGDELPENGDFSVIVNLER